jgi:hypothetical protein
MNWKTDFFVKSQVRVSKHSKEKLLLNNIMYTRGCGKHGKYYLVYIISGSKNINKLILFLLNMKLKELNP